MKNKLNQFKENFPWLIFVTGAALLVFCLLFKAYDMAAVCIIPIVGSIILCIQNYRLDKKFKGEKNVTATLPEYDE